MGRWTEFQAAISSATEERGKQDFAVHLRAAHRHLEDLRFRLDAKTFVKDEGTKLSLQLVPPVVIARQCMRARKSMP